MIQNIVIIGTQWGDEGKGKIIDFLTPQVQYVVRYQGGHNAGHTIVVNHKKVTLHLIPSGILHDNIINIIAGGVVLSPVILVKEIQKLKKINVLVDDRIFISESCSLILPYHIAIDLAREKISTTVITNNNVIIGTTGCGIGPAYEDKVARRALRVYDLYNLKNFENKLKNIADFYNFQLVQYYHAEPIDYHVVMDEIITVSDILIKKVIDVPELLLNARKRGDKIIFEGAQGSLLDIDHGTYPYVTSSHTTSGGAIVGIGVGPKYIDYVLGIMKAYSTRVGNGPFPTELSGDIAEWLCTRGQEFGSTTGRRRRTGWFDAVSVRHAIKISSINSACLTKIDILDGLKYVKICVAYQSFNGEIIYNFPYSLENLKNITPVYEVLPGWSGRTTGIKKFNQLPLEAKQYIKRIEEVIGIPIDIISTGPDRLMNIIVRNPLNF
ncbi:adenylosuccinate synthetase [Candidatus Blochmanniella floridana]|uniref:Adenylosuccinate synthetase n=1 Tax=Blochmanniella floridana TaxID=203907 RepID=PURA_BLOFL|nr:RecName: Full=Adenylosuccinate synthetase; Short=AMPSase; Short=AdSS; AltName: Full=IMP--aspartate ligase [Candidatus Blochmannia floridanus]CAD83606.1 adenylosuccinate synthetase [Candidatus Blochmannia floridanus]